ncbi:hypothetical protein FKW77_008773 [Venturia effusa]|uniref:Uncharacterized protein n=1 Tax=Venturia effusa TaxID=50376 RepID=A0A517LHT8_9PEZI|nr:hypothetical protein FKW77_008773 [Venturia effusa]
MFDRLRSKLGRKKERRVEHVWIDDDEETLGVRIEQINDNDFDHSDDEFGQAEPDGWVAPEMADVLRGSRAASNRGIESGSTRAGEAPSAAPSRRRRRTQPSTMQQARHGSERRSPASPERQPSTRRAVSRRSPEHDPIREPRQRNRRAEGEDSSLDNSDDAEAPHGPYGSVGGIQRGVDLFRAGEAVPDVFMPHLAAHREYPHHLALPYNMEHTHSSLSQGAPLIRGFPAHDAILESMQQNHRENHRGRSS